MKTQDLTGEQLDLQVSRANGWDPAGPYYGLRTPYSTDWRFGGPIIERYKIALAWDGAAWDAWVGGLLVAIDGMTGEAHGYGPTALIAAMRAYVASKFGAEVDDIPAPSQDRMAA